MPRSPILAAGAAGAAWIEPSGEIRLLKLAEAAVRARNEPPITCHMPAMAARLGIERFPALDLLELYAFVRSAQFCLPTPRGLARALELEAPGTLEDEAGVLHQAAQLLLTELAEGDDATSRRTRAIAWAMARGGWRWGPAVLSALGMSEDLSDGSRPGSMAVWEDLPEWSEHAPEPPAGHIPVEPAEARQRLMSLLGPNAEARPQQSDYASAVSAAFLPRMKIGEPNMVIAEAGTGVGKTLGYIAPASVWAEKNGGAVWLSTYTRNLQHQIDGELNRLYPSPAKKTLKAVVRKGRENYLCLLNLEETARGLAMRPQDAVGTGLMARWARATRDGDMSGGDFPGWLPDLIGKARSIGLADRRGECVYAACPHYHKCYIERSIRRARRAEIVIANHALVMIQAALGGLPGEDLGEAAAGAAPTRYVFDEGHHVFDAADGAFAGLLSGQETADMRRWLLGAEGRGRSRARGLKRRIEDLIAGDAEADGALQQILHAARALPGDAWSQRVNGGKTDGATEQFLALVRQQVYARAQDADGPYGLETETNPALPDLLIAAVELERALMKLQEPMRRLVRRLAARLKDEADSLDTATRLRFEAVIRGLKRRSELEIGGWRSMLQALGQPTPPEFVDWFAVDRIDGRDIDVGMHRHWVDPMVPFTASVLVPAHGVVVTSATLTDGSGDLETDWGAAETRTGARHLPKKAIRAQVTSPFDYPAQTRVFVVNDLGKNDLEQVASAYRVLFQAAGGGGLGLFTAIKRLRAVHKRIAPALEADGIHLLAQHVDGMETSTLVDIFRAEEDTCLLGTDAVRDGVDVPGRSLRLIVFDRVPWPRPDILHKARRAHFGGMAYDDMITRLRLKQAFGRLVRRADDHGVFVLLDRQMPSRLAGAFPPGVEMRRVGLAEAVAETKAFLAGNGATSHVNKAEPASIVE